MHRRPPTPALLALALLAGCGARTGLRAPDAGADAEPDAPPVVCDGGAAPSCGNGCIDPGEECDRGADNRLTPALTLAQPGDPESAVRPLARRTSPVLFYRYESASAHTGFEAVGRSNLFLYVDATTNDLSLFAITGRDGDGEPVRQPSSAWSATFTGVPSGARVLVSDDVAELVSRGGDTFTGAWTFAENTDGGVIGPLAWDREWTITVDSRFTTGATEWRYVDGDGSPRPLAMTRAAVLRHRVRPAACRPDCRVPRCGDGHLDGGERCDDGNTRSGDGCSADCRRFE